MTYYCVLAHAFRPCVPTATTGFLLLQRKVHLVQDMLRHSDSAVLEPARTKAISAA